MKGKTSIQQRKKQLQPQTFAFQFQGKRYVIKQRYECQQATLYLTDGFVLQVESWVITSQPYQPNSSKIEPFDPQKESAATLAQQAAATGQRFVFVAELVQQEEEAKPTAE